MSHVSLDKVSLESWGYIFSGEDKLDTAMSADFRAIGRNEMSVGVGVFGFETISWNDADVCPTVDEKIDSLVSSVEDR